MREQIKAEKTHPAPPHFIIRLQHWGEVAVRDGTPEDSWEKERKEREKKKNRQTTMLLKPSL